MLSNLQRDFAVALAILTVSVVLLWLSARGLGGRLPDQPARRGFGSWALFQPPATPTGAFLSGAGSPALQLGSNQWNGFYTSHFQPAPEPQPKPPTTRTLQLTYLGFLQGDAGSRKALVQGGSSQWLVGVGSNLVADFMIASIEPRSLVVTNTAGQTNNLGFRAPATLEVPAP